MPFRSTPKRRQPEPLPAAGPEGPHLAPLDVVLGYHAATKHHPHRFARSLGYMDWDTQPNPFRRYKGAELILLGEDPPAPGPLYDQIFQPGRVAPWPLDRDSVSQLFYHSLALSAWKEYRGDRWSLRVNPSSGNLHPTEGYLVSGPVPGLLDAPAICHYAPYEHALELRRELTLKQWQALFEQLPAGAILAGLTSIHWRESWKYGERAFRYCQHDVGHAIGAIAIAAATLGWETRLLETVTDEELAVLLGVRHPQDQDLADEEQLESEHPDCLLVLFPQGEPFSVEDQRAFHLSPMLLTGLDDPQGTPNRLSHNHHFWPIIDDVSKATLRHEPPPSGFWQYGSASAASSITVPSSSLIAHRSSLSLPARQIIRQRRSAVDMDGVTGIDRSVFFDMLQRTLPGSGPLRALPWRPAVHLALFVHRIRDLAPGLYLLVRDASQQEALQGALDSGFAWQQPVDCPGGLGLYLLQAGDCRQVAQAVSCGQEIAGDGAFAAGMLAEFEGPLRCYGPWSYRRLHWEAGVIGQVLYLEAEAAGVRGTGIGCFFDDSMHQLLGLAGYRTRSESGPSLAYQILYHFTIGGPLEDPRLRTLQAYGQRRIDR